MKEEIRIKKISLYGLGVLVLFLLVGIGVIEFKNSCSRKFSFVNQKFACEEEHAIDKREYRELRERLNTYIARKKSEEKAKQVSVFFRDLESGPTMNIDSTIDFIPASLLKVPLALTYLRLAEEDPSILEREIFYPERSPVVPEQVFLIGEELTAPNTYTVEELIYQAIVYSDNAASQLLYDYLEPIAGSLLSLHETYRSLGIIDVGTQSDRIAVSPKGYASIFRMLYNASYLNPEASEKLLSLLAQTTFNQGIPSGIPEDIRVAHKFGERYFPTGEKQLHDCGIVYYPNNPYLICIMTDGDDFDELTEIISTISRMVYAEVDSRQI